MSVMVCLRAASREDLPALYALDQRCFRQGIAYSREEFESILESRWCVIAAAESAWSQMLGLWAFEIYSRKQSAHILTVEVAPEERQCGLGTLLMMHLEQTARTLGLNRIHLEVAEDNDIAQEFYKRFGYQATGKAPRYYMDRIDAILMEKQITV